MKPSKIPVLLIRHGFTAGNLEGRYVGSTDEPLIPKGREALLRLRASFCQNTDRVFRKCVNYSIVILRLLQRGC